jgi:hypothetical protein
MAALTRLYLGRLDLDGAALAGHALRALVTAAAAPPVTGLARRLVRRLAEFEARREMRLDTRRPAL